MPALVDQIAARLAEKAAAPSAAASTASSIGAPLPEDEDTAIVDVTGQVIDVIPPPPGTKPIRRAAVAAVLYDDRVLLMKRVERAGDPWSGHISLPGGGYQPEDGSLFETAIRETREELNVELSGARFLGRLPPLTPRSGAFGISVYPFVFAASAAVEPVPGPEALSAFWLPLPLAASGALDDSYAYPGIATPFPSWRFEGHVIWGMTWRILGDLLELSR